MLSRDAVVRGVALLLHGTLMPPLRGSAAPIEDIRKVASVLPGSGPPDLPFPKAFQGRWQVTCLIADVKAPLGDTAAPQAALDAARMQLSANRPSAFEARWVATEDSVR